MSLSDKRLGGPGNTKVHGFFAELTLESFDSNDKMFNKNFATIFTSTLPSLLLPAIQMSLLLLDASSKLFYYTSLGNFNIQYHYIINLNGFINYKQYLRAALLKIPVT